MTPERETRSLGRTPGLARHRGHDAAAQTPRSDFAATDDYIGFCEGLRQICGIDLTQYKRPQMERRLRSYWSRLGVSNPSTPILSARFAPPTAASPTSFC